jgi:4a-hydroxytetrahydrobiopterin dehydratase
MSLSNESCIPCKKGEGKLTSEQAIVLLGELDNWVFYPDRIEKRWELKNFAQALAFVNAVGVIAEAQDHHPDVHFGWGYVELIVATHSVGGLSRNDFILAAKIDAIGRND